MASLKTERHHWWPECVSSYWTDEDGGVNWLQPSGDIRRSTPKNFGVIKNGHAIKLGNERGSDSVWDTSFEAEFQVADSNFPKIIDWLDTLDRSGPPFDRDLSSRILTQTVDDSRFTLLLECLISLAVRSPMQREKSVALAEDMRGPIGEWQRNSLIGMNNRLTQQNAVRSLAGRGKALVIFSSERELVFGDGFFSNLPVQGEHWYLPKLLVPLTPWMAVLYTKPSAYNPMPRLVTLSISQNEADHLNDAVQVYARDALFFRSEQPSITEAFSCGKHQIYADHRNSIDQLIHMIPGVPPRDTSLDYLFDFRAEK